MYKEWRKDIFESYLYRYIENEIKDISWQNQLLYSIKAGGKRFRPALCFYSGKSLLINEEILYTIGSAIELLHTASLIHDDLPEIDNDDYRRGKLSHHKQFDQGTAVIAGDYLFFLAFDIITRLNNDDLTKYFIQCSKDLAYGEYLDIRMENEDIKTKESLINMYENKTARLIEFSLSAPSVFVKKSKHHIQSLKKAGRTIGIAFQILDDIKGLKGSFEEIGKTPGKDLLNDKKTIISLMGIKASKKIINAKKREGILMLQAIKPVDDTDYSEVINFLQLEWETIVTS